MDQFDALYDIRAAERMIEESVAASTDVPPMPDEKATLSALHSIAGSLLALAKIEYAKLQRRSDLT